MQGRGTHGKVSSVSVHMRGVRLVGHPTEEDVKELRMASRENRSFSFGNWRTAGADLGGGRGGRGPPFRQGTMPPHPPSRARASPSDDCYAVNRPPLFQNPGSAPALRGRFLPSITYPPLPITPPPPARYGQGRIQVPWRGRGAPSKTLVKSPKVKTLICTLGRMIGCLI